MDTVPLDSIDVNKLEFREMAPEDADAVEIVEKACFASAVGARSAASMPSLNHCGASPSYELTCSAVFVLCGTPRV